MKQNKPLILTDFLSVGEENAITCKQLSKYLGLSEGDLPVAEEISKTVLSIPLYYGMSDEQISYVIEKINQFR